MSILPELKKYITLQVGSWHSQSLINRQRACPWNKAFEFQMPGKRDPGRQNSEMRKQETNMGRWGMEKSAFERRGMVLIGLRLSEEAIHFLLGNHDVWRKAFQEAKANRELEGWAKELAFHNARKLLRINQYLSIRENELREWQKAYMDWFHDMESIQRERKTNNRWIGSGMDREWVRNGMDGQGMRYKVSVEGTWPKGKMRDGTDSLGKGAQPENRGRDDQGSLVVSEQQIRWVSEKLFRIIIRALVKANGLALFVIDDGEFLWLRRSPCEEYTAEFQLALLGLDFSDLKEPVLDVGCGPNACLVEALRDHGVEAYGLDRLMSESSYIYASDWLDFQFAPAAWGTIISNMAFSNHFWHHHLRMDGQHVAYARKYMEMLQSLKQGGKFVYAPGLPFIERFLKETKGFAVSQNSLPPSFDSAEQNASSRFYVTHVYRQKINE